MPDLIRQMVERMEKYGNAVTGQDEKGETSLAEGLKNRGFDVGAQVETTAFSKDDPPQQTDSFAATILNQIVAGASLQLTRDGKVFGSSDKVISGRFAKDGSPQVLLDLGSSFVRLVRK